MKSVVLGDVLSLEFSYPNSHTGNVRILEVNPEGNYVRLFNTSSFKVRAGFGQSA